MSFCIVIYSSLGMLAFWETYEKVEKSVRFVFSREGARSGFGLHFGWISVSFWEHLGAQSQKKVDPETPAKNDGKKVTRRIPSNSGSGRGTALKTSQLYPPEGSHRLSITPLRATRARWRITRSRS